jgi:hypothetical protein
VTEGDVDIYVSKLQMTWNAKERDGLLRLVVEEEARRRVLLGLDLHQESPERTR